MLDAFLSVGASLLGGMMGQDAASSTASAQLAAAQESNKLQKEMFDKNIELQAPFRQAGLNALNQLMYGVGVPNTGVVTATPSDQSYDAIRKELLSKFTTQGQGGPVAGQAESNDGTVGFIRGLTGQTGTSTVDEAGLDAAIRQRMAENAGAAVSNTQQPGGPGYGDLTRDFTMSDFKADPGYDFRMSEGMKAIERSAAARGGLNSGATLKAITRFGQDTAAQEYGTAYNRFRQGQQVKLNPLQSIAGVGRTATGQINSLNSNYATNVGNNLTGAANASGAATIAGSNALSGSLTNGINSWQQANLLKSLFNNGQTGMLSGGQSSLGL